MTEYTDWMISGPKIGACSCDYGCPCEFNGKPTNGDCEGMEAMRIDEGYFGDVRLDGIVFAVRFRWPGAVHEGGGTVQAFVDAGASEEQIEALFKILGGEEQEPTTVFNIYGATIENELDPIFTDIDFECDIENATGAFTVPKVMDLALEPIKNPVTGLDHRAQIHLKTSFEFKVGEMASATFKSAGDAMPMDREKVYGVLCHMTYGPQGIVRDHLLDSAA
ncbi:MAG: DUF1326 domain-containing protein [Rhodospirillales bacterium]|nr:DUF1326 domain-containing protein [Rhodospirillales bacterium]MBO6785674.1 DUF1326 domain-containing protein [Rhodospirillales bacterium]